MDRDNMNKKADFKPYVPAEQAPPELTVTSVVTGILLAVVFGLLFNIYFFIFEMIVQLHHLSILSPPQALQCSPPFALSNSWPFLDRKSVV